MTRESRESHYSPLLPFALIGLLAVLLVGCATPVASVSPAEVVASVSKNSDIRITWEGPESDNAKLSPEAAATLLDSGVLDEQLLRQAPPKSQVLGNTLYADVQLFSYEDWKRRHNVSSAD